MAGYWDRADATRDAIDEHGWLRTGDAARIDDEGFVWIVDRVHDAYEVSGHIVYPGDVERVLAQHPAVADAGVVPHDGTGKGFVVLAAGEAGERRRVARVLPVAPRSARGAVIRHVRRPVTPELGRQIALGAAGSRRSPLPTSPTDETPRPPGDLHSGDPAEGASVQTLDREQQSTLEQLDPGAVRTDMTPTPPRRTVSVAWVLRWSMALLMLGAAGIHFAAMGEHAGVSWSHGLFFGLTAWAQLMLAGLLVLGPARRSIQLAIVVNFAVIVVWMVSRTVGIAIGTDGTPEPVEFADTLCTVFEGLTIALGLVVICGGFARRRIRLGTGWAIGAFVAVVVAALTSFGFSPAIADSSGGGHGHAGGETAVGAERCCGQPPPMPSTRTTPTSSPSSSPTSRSTSATRSQLAAQLVAARDVAAKYPTVADATAAGMIQAGEFSPGVGAHYVALRGDWRHQRRRHHQPVEPRIADLRRQQPDVPTRRASCTCRPRSRMGFAGPNDHWHRHMNTCVRFGARGIEVPFAADSDVTRAMCDADGGSSWSAPPGWCTCLGRPRLGEPRGCVLARQPEPALRRRHRQGRQGRSSAPGPDEPSGETPRCPRQRRHVRLRPAPPSEAA